MRTASGLALIAVGAILAFAVTTTTPLLNVHIVGWILILTGVIGMVIPRRGYGWLRRRMVLKPGARGPVVTRMDETHYPPSILRYPDTRPLARDTDIGQPVGRGDPRDPDGRTVEEKTSVRYPASADGTETIEEFTQE
jgi:hypothetical protein